MSIAQWLDVSQASVSEAIKRLSVSDSLSFLRSGYSKAHADAAPQSRRHAEHHKDGWSASSISRFLKVDHTTVGAALKTMGISPIVSALQSGYRKARVESEPKAAATRAANAAAAKGGPSISRTRS